MSRDTFLFAPPKLLVVSSVEPILFLSGVVNFFLSGALLWSSAREWYIYIYAFLFLVSVVFAVVAVGVYASSF